MDLENIPGPRGLPFLGNIFDIKDDEAPLRGLERLADMYGPIYQLNLRGKRQIVVASAELMKEVMNEQRFLKTAIPGLHKDGEADGLIVADTRDPDWGASHRILRPAFGPIKLSDMFAGMKDIAQQMVLKWARFGAEEEVHVTEDFSNLTLDTIALCVMNYRFNSFYRDGMHPYVAAMSGLLGATAASLSRIPIISTAMSWVGAGGSGIDLEQLRKDVEFMRKTAQDIIDRRRSNPTKKNDFLNMLLYGKDPKTGEVMRDELIAANMQAMLVAGHETTSGMLSFATIFLLQNPEKYRKAQKEVDRVVGKGALTFDHVRELKYLYAVLQETLRLVPTAPTIGKIPHPDLVKQEIVTLAGKYKLEPTDRIRILLGKSMQDPKIFGDDAREFNPERMLESNPDYERIEKYWRPFSEGSRACLGRPFSLQEAVISLALILQNFDLRLTDPMYHLRIKQAITVKPLGLYIKTSLRHGMNAIDLERRLNSRETTQTKQTTKDVEEEAVENAHDGAPLTVLFGSNQGTCQALAQRLASEAASTYGFNPDVVDMDAAVGRLSKEHPTMVITSSYEGEPPDNALQFVQWLENMEGNQLEGVKFGVYGCGHRDWHATFHRIPQLVNDALKAHGGNQIAEIGLSDVSQGNPMADFETWLDKTFLPELKKISPKSDDPSTATALADVEADISTGERVATLHHDLQVGTVKDVQVLTVPGQKSEKRHMEVELPPGSTYECGDYLAVLPQSPEANVRAVMAHFKLPSDATIMLKSKAFSPLPLNTSLSVADVLRNYYELAKPATRRALTLSMKYTSDKSVGRQLSGLLNDEKQFRAEVTDACLSVFDLLVKYPQIEMPFPTFLSLLPPLSIRQYSISSSPLRNLETCTITYSVVTNDKDTERPFYGVATTYLSTLKPGDRIQVATRRTAKQAFRLPLDAESTPLLMFAAGTGLAPFRGFIEQRAIQLEANPNAKLAPAHAFVGCRHSERDRLYAEQMDEWAKAGAVTLHYSFSQEPEKSDGCKHVSDRMLKEADLISSAWMAGARAYTCGNRGFAESVGAATESIVDRRLEARKAESGWTSKQKEDRKAAIFGSFNERAADDVFD